LVTKVRASLKKVAHAYVVICHFLYLKFGLGLHISAFSTSKGTQRNVSIYVRILLPHPAKPVKFIHEKAFDKMGGYLYHSPIQISKSF